MPDVSPQTHANILRAVRLLLSDTRELRRTTKSKNGYKGFDLTESTLSSFHEEVTAVRDRDRLVILLKNADAVMSVLGSDDVAPVVKQAREALKASWEALEKLRT